MGPAAFAGEAVVLLLVGAVAVAAIGGAGNSLNDVVDLNIDRVNRPHRPIAAGAVSRRTGIAVWFIGSGIGLVLSIWLSPVHLAIAGAAVGALVVYNLYLKRVVLAGNLLVAVLVALSLVYGALIVGAVHGVWYAAGFAFLLTFAREILKDAADVRGDAAFHARTLAGVYGQDAAVRLANSVIATTLVITPIPFLIARYSTLYLLVVLIANFLLIMAMWMSALRTDDSLDRSTDLLKWAMLVGMLALASADALE